ncbi:MAG: UDP-N-acetylmuramate dehydrogenase [Candidatus Elarobacter sp.]
MKSVPLLDQGDRVALRDRFGERAHFDEALAPFTWWHIGGPADALLDVATADELAFVLRRVLKRRLPMFVLGSGSNLLVGDGGIRGLVLRLDGDFARLDVRSEDGAVIAQAGGSASLAALCSKVATLGGIGVDGLAGIPATVGGSIRMNAGTDREIGEFAREVVVQTPARPEPHAIDVGWRYRRTTIPRDAIVASTTLRFEQGDPGAVRERLQSRLVRRKATQPVAIPNSGSCFRNPEGDHAGRLIEAVGAKGWREGGAEVSTLHANFIVNTGGASARDVATLLARVRRAVEERFGVDLHLEVHLVGEFTDGCDAQASQRESSAARGA